MLVSLGMPTFFFLAYPYNSSTIEIGLNIEEGQLLSSISLMYLISHATGCGRVIVSRVKGFNV